METINRSTPKARKEHKCDFCSQVIPVGEVYEKSTHKIDDIYVFKNHAACSEIASHLKMYDNCDYGLTGDDFKENIETEYSNIMSKHIKVLMKSPDFIYPSFKEQLEFVKIFHHTHRQNNKN